MIARHGGKLYLLFFFLSVALLLAGAAPVRLSPYAEAVAKTIKFDPKVLVLMMEKSGGDIRRMVGYNENGFQVIIDGVYVPVAGEKTDAVLASLRRELAPLKYMVFVIEMNEILKSGKIGVLKGTDEYEIIRVMHTGGNEYGISNNDIIDRLKQWEKICPFKITGAGHDWIEITFRKLPTDLKAFAEEVYDFCPDAVDQGPGSITDLAKAIKQTRKLRLRWD